jgi:hypothetical protein
VSVGSSIAYRFGGRVAPETDPLYVGTQTAMVASWFAAHTTARDVVFANRFVVRPIAVASRVHVVKPGGSEVRLLLQYRISWHSPALFSYLHDHVTYVVFNRQTGQVGSDVKAWFWYVPADTLLPRAAQNTRGFVNRLGCFNWAHAVFATTDYQVLKVDRATLRADLRRHTTGLSLQCLRTWGVGAP